jgi:hypothetical protein
MNQIPKGKSPFYPGQPVPVELFVGRAEQIDHILTRGVQQVREGKPVTIYVQGEYGIGKSSIAGFVQYRAEQEYGLHGIYAPLGAAETLDEVGAAVLESTLRSGALDPRRSEKVRNWLAKYIGEQSLSGFVTIHAEALKNDAPGIASGMLPFLSEVLARLQDTGVKGIFLVFDEINGISANPKFAHFLKSLVDSNSYTFSKKPLPLLLMLCGVEQKRREMIKNHQPVERIFDVVEIGVMSEKEMENFFTRAFDSVQIKVNEDAMKLFTYYSAGFPKIMHLVGDAAYWFDKDGIIDKDDAFRALVIAAEDVGRKYVDQQVYNALRSQDYHSILQKIAQTGLENESFKKADVAKGLSENEKKKFNNFLQKMKRLKVLRSGHLQGEYIFNMRMVYLYIWMQSVSRQSTGARPSH